jgi:hypothetical protein
MTNRSWFVREQGAHRIHSRTVSERVSPLISLTASQTTQLTIKPIVFTGHVTPNHAFDRVHLQAQIGGSDKWRTVDSARLTAGSNYAITHRFRFPGVYSVRVVFRGDNRNIRGESDPVTVTSEQRQEAGFTIHSSDYVIPYGQSVTISGVLDRGAGSAPARGVAVTLFGKTVGGAFKALAATTTGSDGGYRFTQSPASNTIYQVQTTFAPRRHSAVLYQGVKDIVSLVASSLTSHVGEKVTLAGTVLPDKSGAVIYLQRQAADGRWHTVKVGAVRGDSTFQFTWTFGNEGTKTFRARMPGDPQNVGGASAPVTITVGPPTSLSGLPPGS